MLVHNKHILIDVLIPVFNAERTIEGAIASIQAQTVRDIRIVVVNDGSTDDSLAILERVAAADPRVVLLNQPNAGIVGALNAGLAQCTAELIARHDADDLALPDRFEKQVDFLRKHPNCLAVSGAIIHIDQNGRELGPKTTFDSPETADPLRYPQKEPYLVHPFLMMRRAAAQAVGGYRYAHHAEDTDLYWRLQEIGSLANMDDLLGYYRVHDQSITGTSTQNGRISALSSQLSGLSALRRRAGKPDLMFPPDILAEYKQASSIQQLVALGARGLDPEEAKRLAASTATKLVELAAYRPYEVNAADCAYIRGAVARVLPAMTAANRALTIRSLSGTAARLMANGQIASALRLCPPRFFHLVAARLVMRLMLSTSLRNTLRRLAGRPAFAK